MNGCPKVGIPEGGAGLEDGGEDGVGQRGAKRPHADEGRDGVVEEAAGSGAADDGRVAGRGRGGCGGEGKAGVANEAEGGVEGEEEGEGTRVGLEEESMELLGL